MLEQVGNETNWKTGESATYSKGQASRRVGKSVLGKDVKLKQ